MTILVLVESPAKCAKINSFLGDNYEVLATFGHIRQLPHEDLGFSIENNYEPTFEIMPDKVDVVKKIKAKAKGAENIILCSDDDNEGGAIAWHAAEVINIPANKRFRATFTEITKNAVCKAVNHTLETKRLINMNIVYAQFARMILDKLIGYKVSPLLWKEYNNWKLSAGRVQSVVVKIIAEREAEIAKFTTQAVFKIDANFILNKQDLEKVNVSNVSNISNKTNTLLANSGTGLGNTLLANSGTGLGNTINFISTQCENEIKEQSVVEEIYNNTNTNTNTSIEWIIKSINKTNSKRNPPPPYITSTLQQDASAKLGMSPDVCMKTAQKLYEAGLITYMRTDAVFIAEDAHKAIKLCIDKKWGDKYYRKIAYKNKSNSAQEAHECCRPVDFTKESIFGIEGMTGYHNRLYQLIWRRTVSSQMSAADFEIRTVKIEGKSNILLAIAKGIIFVGKHEKVIFEGYIACNNLHKKANVNIDVNDNGDADGDADVDADGDADGIELANSGTGFGNIYLEKIFTQLKEGQQVYVSSMIAQQKYTKPSQSRYTEASIIKKLDDLGIGRPSTYANMIKKVQEEQRQYVEKKSLPPKQVKVILMKYNYPNKIQIAENDMKIEGDKNKLFPTSLGIMINEYLDKNFIELMNYEFTAQIELLLDEIALGTKIWYKVIDSVYIKLNPIIDQLSKAITLRKANKTTTPNADNANKRLLGNHPKTNLPVYALKSRKGLLICESNPEKTKSRFANFTGNFELITLEQATALLIFPQLLGQYKEHDVILKKAKNIYIHYNNVNYSIDSFIEAHTKTNANIKGLKETVVDGGVISKPCNWIPEKLTLEQAQNIILYYEELNKAKSENAKKDRILSDDIVIKVGPYGAYIKYKGERNVPLSKAFKSQWETITLEECLPIIEKNANRKPRAPKYAAKAAPKKAKAAAPKAPKATKTPKIAKAVAKAPKAAHKAAPKIAPKIA